MCSKAGVDPTHPHTQTDIIIINVKMHNSKSIVDRKQLNKKRGNNLKHSKKRKEKKKTEQSSKIAKNTTISKLLARNTKFKSKFNETRTRTKCYPHFTDFSKHYQNTIQNQAAKQPTVHKS